ncbi:lasso peptide biosynthesis PqqD family chaperone [Paenibacillus medicaginis]|uniref:Lasso peptide biosynthesis PqqD family chaperone n=1 Tax=Paenibacillus medicaginis TaxID=1470560 RepID=A0ABV5BYM1_9BACL
MKNNISVHDTILRCSGNLASDMDGDKVMMSIESGKYYNLGKVGGRIWELAISPVTISQIVEALVAEYDIERGLCEQQVITFVAALHKENLIQLEEEVSA